MSVVNGQGDYFGFAGFKTDTQLKTALMIHSSENR